MHTSFGMLVGSGFLRIFWNLDKYSLKQSLQSFLQSCFKQITCCICCFLGCSLWGSIKDIRCWIFLLCQKSFVHISDLWVQLILIIYLKIYHFKSNNLYLILYNNIPKICISNNNQCQIYSVFYPKGFMILISKTYFSVWKLWTKYLWLVKCLITDQMI